MFRDTVNKLITRSTSVFQVLQIYSKSYTEYCEPGSSVGIATGYGLDSRGSNPGGGEIFRNCPDRPWAPLSLLYNQYRVPGGKERPGRDADHSPPSSAVVMKE